MAIVYRTSDTISLEETETSQIRYSKLEQHGTFTAPCYKYLASNTPEYGVYSAPSSKNTQLILVAHHNPSIESQSGIGYIVRGFTVAHRLVNNTIAQLLRNKGCLDNEFSRIHAVTHGFKYSIQLDSQNNKLYDAEHALYRLWDPINRGRRVKILEDLNANEEPDSPRWVFSQRDAVAFGEYVLAEYGITDIRLEGGTTLPGAAAECSVIAGNRRMYFARNCKMRLGFHPSLPITRGAILHEISHALDLREFGGFSHGPTFVLIYCELLAKFTSLQFVKSFDFFVSKGLKVTNPIYSDQFFSFDKRRRDDFKRLHQEETAR